MSVRETVVRGKHTSSHICQFFDSDESRADAVAAFLEEGCRANEYVIVVARPLHWAAILERLEGRRIPVTTLMARGRIVVKDAMDTLRRLSPHGTPNAFAFDEHVGTSLRGLADLGRVRAYGEMVDILAQRGEFAEALKLEELWNQLAEVVPFSLMCGYSAAHFVGTASHRSMHQICRTHSEILRNPQDTLASWLLSTVHDPLATASSSH